MQNVAQLCCEFASLLPPSNLANC